MPVPDCSSLVGAMLVNAGPVTVEPVCIGLVGAVTVIMGGVMPLTVLPVLNTLVPARLTVVVVTGTVLLEPTRS